MNSGISVFIGEYLGSSFGQGQNGLWYRVNFLCGEEKLQAYATKEVFDQLQSVPRLTGLSLGIVVSNRNDNKGWSGRIVEVKVK